MAFKDLLVHLDNSDECEFRVNAAIALAKRQDAGVSGVALALESTISTYIGIDIPSSLSDTQKELVQQSALSAVEKFEKAAKEAGVSHTSEIVSCGATKAPAVLGFSCPPQGHGLFGPAKPRQPRRAISGIPA